MFVKRFLALAAGLLLFVIFFIAYFGWANSEIENHFREERVQNGVEGKTVTTGDSAFETPAPSAPIATTATPDSSAPAASSTPVTTSPDSTAPDTNTLIGPVPPQSTTPDNPPAPSTPPPADSNAAPMAPSTMDYRPSDAPFLVRAAYHPFDGVMVQATGIEPASNSTVPVAPAPPGTEPATNAGAAPPAEITNAAPSSSPPATNAASATGMTTEAAPSGPARPVPVEASVIVLLYHQFVPAGAHISPKFQWTMNQDVFAEEMKYIHDNGYHVIPMSDLLKFLKHEIGLPPNSVVITIDDGYKSAIVYAAPILKQYGYPWTFFVYPDFITVNEGKGAASWNDLLALQADGVDIESHSMTHPQLTRKSQKFNGRFHTLTPDEYDQFLTNETLGAKTLLEQKMGKKIICFAYPYGDYNKQVEAKAIAAGYEAIFTVADNPVHSTTNPFSIGRYTITQSVIKNFTAYLRQGALGLANADPAPGATITNPRPVITAVLGYAGNIDPNTIETSVRDFGEVKHDFDPKTLTLRLYLPRDLVQQVNLVNLRMKDAQTGQVLVANWHFNYQPVATAEVAPHAPIASGTNAPPALTNAPASSPPPPVATNSAPASTNAPPSPPATTATVARPPATTTIKAPVLPPPVPAPVPAARSKVD